MSKPVELLLIEDSKEDAFLILRELGRHLPEINHTRIETLADLDKALQKEWDIILCDFTLPGFDGLTALHMVRQKGNNTPFILVSGMVEEGIAANMMRLGANDYIMKDNLKRLAPAVLRELGQKKIQTDLKAATGAAFDSAGQNVAGEAGQAKSKTPADKQNELLDFIESSRKESGQGAFIKERHKAVVNVLYVAGLIKKHQDKVLEEHDLTEPQFNVLRILKRHEKESTNINIIREEITNKTSDVSRLIERMANVGLLHYAKNKKDKRVRDISITEKGIEVLDKMNKAAEQMFLPETYLSEPDAQIINEKLKKLLDALGE